MAQAFHQQQQQGIWTVVGPPAACALQLAQPLVVTYADGTTATLPAHTPALTSTGATQVDRTGAVWVAYVQKGETPPTVRLAKEQDLPALALDYAPLARLLADRVVPYQPSQTLLSGAGARTADVCLSSTAARCHNVSPPTDSAETDYPGWSTAGFDDSAWAHAVVAHHDSFQDPEIPAGASSIDDLAARPSTEGAQKLLVRQTVTLPSEAPLGASLRGGADAWGDFYVNGTHIGTAGNPDGSGSGALAPTDVPVSLLVPGGANVVAVQLQDIARSSVHNRFCAFALSCSYASSAIGDPGGVEGGLLYYHNGTWTARPIGTAGQELTVVSGVPQWATPPSGYADPLTTKADLLTRTASATVRQGVGADGLALTADATQSTGLRWADAAAVGPTRWEPIGSLDGSMLVDSTGSPIMALAPSPV